MRCVRIGFAALLAVFAATCAVDVGKRNFVLAMHSGLGRHVEIDSLLYIHPRARTIIAPAPKIIIDVNTTAFVLGEGVTGISGATVRL